MEGGDIVERVVDAQQRSEQADQHRPRVLEDSGNPRGVRNDRASRQGDLPCAPALPVFGPQGM